MTLAEDNQAMYHNYRNPILAVQALAEIMKCANKDFDPRVIRALAMNLGS